MKTFELIVTEAFTLRFPCFYQIKKRFWLKARENDTKNTKNEKI